MGLQYPDFLQNGYNNYRTTIDRQPWDRVSKNEQKYPVKFNDLKKISGIYYWKKLKKKEKPKLSTMNLHLHKKKLKLNFFKKTKLETLKKVEEIAVSYLLV